MKTRAFVLLVMLALVFATPRAANPPGAAAAPPAEDPPLFWRKVVVDFYFTPIYDLVADPAVPGSFLALLNTLAGPRLAHSADHGATWSVRPGYPPYDAPTYRLVYGRQRNTFYAYSPHTIYKTTDAGTSWSLVSRMIGCNTLRMLVAHPTLPDVLYAGREGGFARTIDGGRTWQTPDAGPNCVGGPIAMSISAGVDQTNVVYAGEQPYYRDGAYRGGGVYRSEDFGWTWARINAGIEPGRYEGTMDAIPGVYVDPRDTDVVYAAGFEGAYKTTNGGQEWTQPASLSDGMGPIEPTLGYRMYIYYDPNKILVLEDGASQARRLPLANPGYHGDAVIVDPTDPTRFIAWDTQGVYITHALRSQVWVPIVSACDSDWAEGGDGRPCTWN